MKIDVEVSGHGPVPGTALAQYTLAISFDGPVETMTLTVMVPNEGSEASMKAQAIARAKELARKFYETASA